MAWKQWLGLVAALAAAVGAHALPLPAGLEPIVEAIAVLVAGRNTALVQQAPPAGAFLPRY